MTIPPPVAYAAPTKSASEPFIKQLDTVLPPPPLDTSGLPEMETFEVELIKDQQGLGITIAGYVCEKGIFSD